MKTRLISTTVVILFAALTVAGATNIRIQNSSPASSHENITEQNFTDLNSCYPSAESLIMGEWIDSRDNWEQEGQSLDSNVLLNDPAILEEWVTTRDNWEQIDQNLTGEKFPVKSSLIEEWTASAENWEQR